MYHSSSEDTPDTLAAMSANKHLKQWQLSGKVGLRENHQAHSAYLNWQQCDEYFDIHLTGPLGQSAAHLFGNANTVTLQRANQAPITASTPEALLKQELGWSIPISQLLYWVIGTPKPTKPFSVSKEHIGFKQAGWLLTYPKIRTTEGYSLPAKAIAKQASLTVTVLAKHWDLTPDCKFSP